VRSCLGPPSPRVAWPAGAGMGQVDLASHPCGSELAGVCDGDDGGEVAGYGRIVGFMRTIRSREITGEPQWNREGRACDYCS
jgi:hypothetical protein